MLPVAKAGCSAPGQAWKRTKTSTTTTSPSSAAVTSRSGCWSSQRASRRQLVRSSSTRRPSRSTARPGRHLDLGGVAARGLGRHVEPGHRAGAVQIGQHPAESPAVVVLLREEVLGGQQGALEIGDALAGAGVGQACPDAWRRSCEAPFEPRIEARRIGEEGRRAQPRRVEHDAGTRRPRARVGVDRQERAEPDEQGPARGQHPRLDVGRHLRCRRSAGPAPASRRRPRGARAR